MTLKDFERTEEERMAAVSSTSLEKDLPGPRVWYPIYDSLASYPKGYTLVYLCCTFPQAYP